MRFCKEQELRVQPCLENFYPLISANDSSGRLKTQLRWWFYQQPDGLRDFSGRYHWRLWKVSWVLSSSHTDEGCWVTFLHGSSIPQYNQWKIPHKESTHFFNASSLSKGILALFFCKTPFSCLTQALFFNWENFLH